jgi:serine/threonine-protein kinase
VDRIDEAPPASVTLAGRFRLLEVIGEGGMGKVFRAEQLATGRVVALKLLNPELSNDEDLLRRFEREAKVTARLSHPNIVKAVEFGAADGHVFLAMELVDGRSLADLIEQGRWLGVARTLAIMGPVLKALAYAHRRGVVHRDLKPANIMVTSRESVKVLDFGIAKLGNSGHTATQKLTRVGSLLGTPSYMSPEQAMGQPADARSDIYSCGVMLYEMLTGQRPFVADLPVQVMSMQLNAMPKPLRHIAPEAGIPLALEAVVLRALAKRPDDRFQSAVELRRALRRAARAKDRAAVSGIDATALAAPDATGGRSSWMRPLIIAVSVAMLVAEHRRGPKTPRSAPPPVASPESNVPSARAHGPAAAKRPPSKRERARRSSPH